MAEYEPNTGVAFRPLQGVAKAFYEQALAHLATRHNDRVMVLRRAMIAEAGTGTCGRTAYEEAFACAVAHKTHLYLSPPFFRLSFYPQTGVENAAFALMHESFHLELDGRLEPAWIREARAYSRSWPHKADFGFFARHSTYWRDITQFTDYYTAKIPNVLGGRSFYSVVDDQEWAWAIR